MRRSLIVGPLVASAAIAALVLPATRGDDAGEPASTGGLDTQTVSAGEVDIEIEPRQLDAGGAVFAITLDTHAVELDSDLAADARLEVGGESWPVLSWEGDGPGGHHREGELRFEAAGAPGGTVRLTIAGFSDPVEVAWDLG